MKKLSIINTLLFHVLMIVPNMLVSMEQLITNRLDLLPPDVHNKIAKIVAADFLSKKKDAVIKKNLANNDCPDNKLSGQSAALAFHPRKNSIIVATPQTISFSAEIIDLNTDKWLTLLNIPSPITGITFNKEGDQIAIASSNKIWLWNEKNYNLIARIGWANSPAILFNPHNNYLTIATTYNGIVEWDTNNNRAIHIYSCNRPKDRPLIGFNTNPKKTLITIPSCSLVAIEIAENPNEIQRHNTLLHLIPATALAYNLNTNSIALTTDTHIHYKSYDAAIVSQSEENYISEKYIGVAMHPTKNLITTLSDNGTVKFFKPKTFTLLETHITNEKNSTIPTHSSQNRITFNADGNMLAIAFQNKYELWRFSHEAENWLDTNISINLAALIERINTANENRDFFFWQEEETQIFENPTIPAYVRDFLNHYLKI